MSLVISVRTQGGARLLRPSIPAADNHHKLVASPNRKTRARQAIEWGMTTLEGSTALVTGATAGIGRAIAQQLAGLGAEVVVHGRSPKRGAETVRAIENSGGKARFVAADLSRADEVRRLADEAGEVDILINNAGVYRFGATADTDDAFFDEHVNLNLRALHPGPEARAGHGRPRPRRRRQHQHGGRLYACAPPASTGPPRQALSCSPGCGPTSSAAPACG
jgi:NAD(P)-dependent dehydrogenase (short-subunit alcohol dehydrogenase family)